MRCYGVFSFLYLFPLRFNLFTIDIHRWYFIVSYFSTYSLSFDLYLSEFLTVSRFWQSNPIFQFLGHLTRKILSTDFDWLFFYLLSRCLLVLECDRTTDQETIEDSGLLSSGLYLNNLNKGLNPRGRLLLTVWESTLPPSLYLFNVSGGWTHGLNFFIVKRWLYHFYSNQSLVISTIYIYTPLKLLYVQ